jgi:hypothetical protein
MESQSVITLIITITVTSEDYKSIEKTFQQSTSVKLSFLGIPLASSSQSSYSSSTSVDRKTSTVTITLTPPLEMIAGSRTDSMGWVLGAVVNYPADGEVNFSETDKMSAKGVYPNYQLYEDSRGATFCSNKKLKSHAVGSDWVKDCLKAHPGTSCKGKPWTSNTQDGTVWP